MRTRLNTGTKVVSLRFRPNTDYCGDDDDSNLLSNGNGDDKR